MALSPMAIKIAQWILGGRQGPPPAGATAQDIAAAGVSPPVTGTTDSGDAVTSGPPPVVGTATAADRGQDKLPYPNPKDEYERARNQEQRLLWQLEDADAAITAARSNPTSPDFFNIPQLETNRSRINSDLTSQQATVQRALTAREVEEKKKPHTITKQERGPDGETYIVTYDVDAAGNEKWNGQKPVKLDLGTSPTAGLDLQTAQFNLQRAQAQLAQENDPLKKAQLQLAVDQARFTLQQAQAKAPLDLKTGELAYENALLAHRQAQLEYEQATDETSRETRRVALEQAKVALDAARQGLARGNAPQIVPADTASPVIVTRDPTTGALKSEPNPAYQGPTFADATAAYNAQVPRLQQAARTERDRLLELQRQGAISEADAERQFTQWFAGNVETPLAGYRAAAEEAQRKEQRENEALQRAENQRAELLNRQREQIGLEAGQKAMLQLAEIAPQIRTPQFLSQFGATVERMGQRAGAQSAEAAAALPSGSTFTKDTFSTEQARPHVPDFNQFAQQATQRALAQISPAVAAKIGATPPPALPQGPTLASMLQGLPYRGPLAGLPSPASGLQPTPGMNPALDIGGGMARTPYGPGGNVWLDWNIPQ